MLTVGDLRKNTGKQIEFTTREGEVKKAYIKVIGTGKLVNIVYDGYDVTVAGQTRLDSMPIDEIWKSHEYSTLRFPKEYDYPTVVISGKLVENKLELSEDQLSDWLPEPRPIHIGNLKERAFLLDVNFNWQIVYDSYGALCLLPTKK